jgi:DNA repair protein RadC
MTIHIKDMPKSDRPRERLAELGAKNLTLQELMAVIIRTGNSKGQNAIQVAAALLKLFENDLNDLFCASIEELKEVDGIGFAKACQIKAVFELGIRIGAFYKESLFITSTDDVVNRILPHMRYLKQEHFIVVLLDSKNRFIRSDVVSMGSLDSALLHPREVFRPAVRHAASSMILAHNHPSGDPTPSDEDMFMTKKICMCGAIMDIEVLDHVIIGNPDYVSMKLRNLM